MTSGGNNLTSTGRGGAGNIADAARSAQTQAADLETPTLKTAIVTTGRGGVGNMARNTDPKETRMRQDVGPVARRESEGAQRFGRGGAANVARLIGGDEGGGGGGGGADKDRTTTTTESAIVDDDVAVDSPHHDQNRDKKAADGRGRSASLAAKGKEWLFGKKS